MPRRRIIMLALVLAITSRAWASRRGILNGQFLGCYKFKDPSTYLYRLRYAVGVIDNAEAQARNCFIKYPPKLACFSSTISPPSPKPPGGGPTTLAGRFFCYAVKCRTLIVPLTGGGTDMFGFHETTSPNGNPAGPTMFCAPASPSGAFLD
jgi:hypothetical protein